VLFRSLDSDLRRGRQPNLSRNSEHTFFIGDCSERRQRGTRDHSIVQRARCIQQGERSRLGHRHNDLYAETLDDIRDRWQKLIQSCQWIWHLNGVRRVARDATERARFTTHDDWRIARSAERSNDSETGSLFAVRDDDRCLGCHRVRDARFDMWLGSSR